MARPGSPICAATRAIPRIGAGHLLRFLEWSTSLPVPSTNAAALSPRPILTSARSPMRDVVIAVLRNGSSFDARLPPTFLQRHGHRHVLCPGLTKASSPLLLAQRRIRMASISLSEEIISCRATFKNRLVNLYFQGARVVGGRIKWSEERSSPRKVALRLCNTRLRARVSTSSGINRATDQTSAALTGNRRTIMYDCALLGEQRSVARIEALSLVEVQLALLPLTRRRAT